MNQNHTKTNSPVKSILFAILASIPLGIGTFLLCAYVFQCLPKYQRFLPYFPWVFTLLLSLVILALCMAFRFPSVMTSALISGFFALFSGIWGLIFMTESISLPLFIGLRVFLIALSVSLHFLCLHKKKSRRRVAKRPNFAK